MALVARAIGEPAGVSVEPTRDYRGVPVVGAWRWVEEHQFGVVTKIDADEAFRTLRVLRWIFRILLLFVVLGAVVGVVASHAGSVWRRRFNEAQVRARQLGQYTLVERIGEGAMGVVYRGRHALLRRDTAVKLLLPDRADEGLIRQFEHEVQLTCRLTHPNTIQVYDYGHTADGIFYYAMELLEGMTWEELVDRHGPVPQERLIHLLRQAAGSLQEAHAAGLIHRDIKPGNLFLCERGGIPDTVKVLDFGLVREVSAGAVPDSIPTQAARFLGTPLYMAPETIRTPGHGDVSTDLYALGAVAYHLATGRPVFVAESVEATWEQHLTAKPMDPSQRVPGALSPHLESLILDCLAKDPAARPDSMGNFIARLDACPVETTWTLEDRKKWWRLHGTRKGAVKTAATPQAATIRIALEER
jgi:serine/threonine protein kinase